MIMGQSCSPSLASNLDEYPDEREDRISTLAV